MDELGGLAKKMPITASAALLAALSMAGLPPFFGFVGKELIYQGAVDQQYLSLLVTGAAMTANILMVAVAGIILYKPFFGVEVKTPHSPHEAPWRMWVGPVVMAGLGVGFGLAVSWVGDLLIQPAVRAIVGKPVPVQLGLFHGFNIPLLLSAATVAAGLLVFNFRGICSAAVRGVEAILPFSGDQAYDGVMKMIYGISHWQTDVLQHGSMSRYLATIFATIALSVGYTLLYKGGVFGIVAWPQLYFYEWALVGLILGGIVVTLLAYSRLMAICAMGVIGSCVGLIYLIYGAPDVALTQLTVEILVVVLVTVALLKLPGHATIVEAGGMEKIARSIIAVSVGAMFTVLLIGVNSAPMDMRITDYYSAYSYSLAHGRNIVNVVLVDFRGFDTMGEITVLSVAGLTAYQMIKLRMGRGKE